MLPVRELAGGGFKRVAQMNELYAQEVKEEVLRELGRVGTQIDPPPAFSLHATLRWRITNGSNWNQASVDRGSFYSAIVSYSEQSEKAATVILSDEFKKWAETQILESLNGQEIPKKLKNCLDYIFQSSQFILKSDFSFKKNELVVRVESDANGANMNGMLLDVALNPDVR